MVEMIRGPFNRLMKLPLRVPPRNAFCCHRRWSRHAHWKVTVCNHHSDFVLLMHKVSCVEFRIIFFHTRTGLPPRRSIVERLGPSKC